MAFRYLNRWLHPSSEIAQPGRRRSRRPVKRSHRPRLEVLEARTLPTVTFIPQLANTTPSNNTDVARGLAIGAVPSAESQITVNPLDPAQIALSSQWNLQVSNDGGVTYPNPVLSFPVPPGVVQSGDTSTVFDSRGRLFWANLGTPAGGALSAYVVQVNPLTGTALGTATLVSTPPTTANSTSFDDKVSVAADGNGNLFLSWIRFTTVTKNGNPVNFFYDAMLSRSTNGGTIWSTPIAVSNRNTDGFVWPSTVTVAPNGEVYVAYHSQPNVNTGDHSADRVTVVRYTNDLSAQLSNSIALPQARIRAAYPNSTGINQLSQGVGQAWVMADPVRPGIIYVVGVDDPSNGAASGDPADVVFSRSTDFGVTWHTEQTIDAGPSNSYQLFVTGAIDTFGDIAIAWYDNRAFQQISGNYLVDVYAKYSTDGANTWSSSFKVSDRATDFLTQRADDYFGIYPYGDKVYVAWEGNTFDAFGNRQNAQQVWTDSFSIRGTLQFTDPVGANDNIILRTLASNPTYFELLQGTTRLYAGQWSDMNNITIDTGLGTDAVNIEDVPRGVSVTVYTGTGSSAAGDTVYIGRDKKLLKNIVGNVTVYGDNADNDQLIINDQSSVDSNLAITVTGNTVRESRSVKVGGFTTGLIQYLGVFRGGLAVNGGALGNRFVVNSTHAFATTLDTGGGPDNIMVKGTTGPLAVHGDGGQDTVNMGLAGSVATIGNTVFVSNAGGFSAVTVDDSANKQPRTVLLYSQVVLGESITTISGFPTGGDISLVSRQLKSLVIDGGLGGNTFRIHDTPFSLTPGGAKTTVNTGTGTDGVTVDGTSGELDLNVQGGITGQSITIGSTNGSLDRIQGAINFSGPGGTNFVAIDDRLTTAAQNLTHTITATTYTRTGAAPIRLSDVYGFTLWCGSAANVVNVQGQPTSALGNSPLNILGGPSHDIINLGTAANRLAGVGSLIVNGQGGADALNVFDQGTAAPRTYTLAFLLGDPSLPYLASDDLQLRYSNLGSLNVFGGSRGNHFVISGTSPSTLTTVHTGSANAVVTVGNALDAIKGPLTIDGQGVDDRLVLNDSASASGQTYTVLRGSVSRANTTVITFAGVEHLDLIGTHFNDSFRMGNALQAPQGPDDPQPVVSIDGDGGTDGLTGPNTDTMWTLTGPGSGSMGDVSFSAISNLLGGSGVDTFAFGANASIGGLNGGGGGDWLDYSALSTGVTVNLATGAATGVSGAAAGAVSNIQNVAGGAGTNQLTGNTLGNILMGGGGTTSLTGGTGRSLLIGGAGNATIAGGANDDIVIGGKTGLDHAALASILADWQRTDKTYAERIENLHCGDGSSAANQLLYLVTLQAGGTDQLTGGPGQDWFFQFPADTITDLNNGGTEQVENARLTTGNLGYAMQFGATSGYAQGDGITTDAAGNVYTVGVFSGTMNFDPRQGGTYLTSQGYFDTYVAKYSPQGNLLWVQQWGGNDTSLDATSGVHIKVDGAGNVYVDGYFYGSTTMGGFSFRTAADDFNQYDGFIAKLNSTGTVQWARQVASTASGGADLNSFVVDSKGNLFVSGYYQSTATLGAITLTSAGNHDGLVTKLDSAGTFVWARSLGGSDLDEAYGMSMDASGNLYTSGYFTGTAKFGSLSLTSAGGEDGFLAKFNGSGSFLWVRQLGGSLHDYAGSVQVDSAGNVYTTGDFGATSIFGYAPSTFVAKYSSAGNLLWIDQFNDSANRSASASVALDSAGGVYLNAAFSGTVAFGGTTVTSAGDFDVAVVKLTSAGAVTWVRQFGGTGSDTALDMAVDSSFNIYTTGWFQNTVDVDPGPDTCNLTSHNNPDAASTTDTFVWQLTQLGAMSYTAPAGSGSASYDLRLQGGYVQLVDAATNTVLLSKAQVDTTSVSIQAANGVKTSLVVDFGGGSYTFPVTFTGGSGSNTLVGANVPNNWTVTGANAGAVGNVHFTKVATLVGGSGVDVFTFGSSGSISGKLDGGAAPAYKGDWLDYSGLTTSVSVNLQTGSATKVGGGAAGKVTNIQDIHGGNGSNTLTGNGQGNILIGGTGADTLIGGTGLSILIGDKGADNITGGSGGDILIGDYTTYDAMSTANEDALMSILSEWQSGDSYATRFSDINTGTGGGLNGTAKLNYGTTVKDDLAGDTVTATDLLAGLDWFFASNGDMLNNFEMGEHLNNT